MPAYPHPDTYLAKLEREMERLRVSKTSILILELGKDKFSLSDGNRSVSGHGSKIMRVLKKMPSGAGYGKFFESFHNAEGIRISSSRKIVLHTA